jgi:hypothetical protein
VRRNDARRHLLPCAALAATTLLVAGCAGADEPGGTETTETAAGSSASASADAAPASASACAGGVVVEWQGSPTEKKVYTAIVLSTVSGSGAIKVVDSWDRQEDAGVRVAKGATDAQHAVVEDAVAGGLLEAERAPRLADPTELLVGKSKGRYIQYSYTRHSTQDAVVSCADGSEAVDVAWTSFELMETGLSSCTDTPDPVAEYAAADAISTFCDRA